METEIIREIKKISLDPSNRFSFIAKYIISNFAIVPKISIKELAKLTYSSSSTINRFTKYLNLSGYKELVHLIKYFNYTLIESNKKIDKNDNYDVIYETYHNVTSSIDETFNLFLLQEETAKIIVKKIIAAEKINIFAVGGTYNIASTFQKKLLRIGFNVVAINNFHDGFFLSKQTNEKTFNIIISYSGETKDLIKLARFCKENNSQLLVISKKTNNSLNKMADFKLGIASNESIIRTISVSSSFALMLCLDLLFYKILLTNFKFYKEVLQKTSLNKF